MENFKELIPIRESNGKRAVNARDLHAFLESKRDFSNWIKDRIKAYDFIEIRTIRFSTILAKTQKVGARQLIMLFQSAWQRNCL